ncbi:MAG: sulfatase [Thermoanaerobaculia bacterium]
MKETSRGAAWTALAALTTLAVFFAVFMEWLFFATQPSFLSALGLGEQLRALGVAALPPLAAGLAGVTIAAALSLYSRQAAGLLGRSVPALIFTASFLLLADNFTHTVFHFGIFSLRGYARFLYTPVLAALALAAWRLVRGCEAALLRRRGPRAVAAAAGVALTLAAAGAAIIGRREEPREMMPTSGPGSRPNILILGSDGVEARHLSLYGYQRETTPFLAALAGESLVFDNAYSNAGNTGGSITSILTGRLPTATRVIYPPDVLHGEDAYRHLPRILRGLGYRAAQLSVRHYADAVDLNLRESFDWANFRPVGERREEIQDRALGQTGGYFLQQIAERLAGRLRHLLTRNEQEDPYRQVTDDRTANHGDDERLTALFRFLGEPDPRPFFVHVHLMGTHGATFEPGQRRFSRGQEQTEGWLPDFYDDAILDFDGEVRQVVSFLRRKKMLDRTILVIYSDHGMRYTTAVRVPMLVRLPGGTEARRVSAVVQNLDIAPTLLDALGVAQPPWMSGRSLLRPGLEPCRPVLSVAAKPQIHLPNNLWVTLPTAPFYSLGRLSLLTGGTGGRQLTLTLPEGALVETPAEGAGPACPAPPSATARDLLIDHLRRNGFDVSNLTR